MITPIQGCGRRTRRLLAPLVAEAAAVPGADRYRKRFSASAHLWMCCGTSCSEAKACGRPIASSPGTRDAFERLGLPHGISRAQLIRSSTSRPSVCAETLFDDLVALARRHHRIDPAWVRLQHIQAIDSTFIGLSVSSVPGVRMGGMPPASGCTPGSIWPAPSPPSLRLTLTDTHDAAALDARIWRS